MTQPGNFSKSVVCAACVFAMSGVWAQASSPAAGASGGTEGAAVSGAAKAPSSLAAADRNFIMRAAASSMFEVEAARLAAEQAKDENVKRYAAMLADHHQAANQELTGLAQSKGITLPSSLPAGKRHELERLKRTPDDDFDAVFVQDVGVREHRQDVRLFRDASRQSKDPEIKAWAAKTLPALEQHLKEARALPAARQARQPVTVGSS